MRTAILVLCAALLATACAPGAAAVAGAAAPDRPPVAIAAAAEGELTLDITELI